MANSEKPLVALIDVEAKMGGVEFSTLYLAQRSERNSFNYIVICPEDGPLVEKCRQSGIQVEIIPRFKLYSTALQFNSKIVINPFAWVLNFISVMRTGIRYGRILKAYPIQVICTKGVFAHFYGAIAGLVCRIPVVIHMQDLLSERIRGLYALTFGLFARAMSDHIIADGTTIKTQLSRYVSSERITVVHNGIDTEQFTPAVSGQQVRQEWEIRDEILIGNVARMTSWKGQDYLVEAFTLLVNEFPNIRLVLVGSPVFATTDFERQVHEMIHSNGVEDLVILAGFRYDLPEVLAAIDIFAYTAIEKDTSPLSVVSAMASGKPIVCTNIAGIVELFPIEGAVIVSPKNTQELAMGLRKLIIDKNERTRLASLVRIQAVQNLGLDNFARQCEEVFRQVFTVTE